MKLAVSCLQTCLCSPGWALQGDQMDTNKGLKWPPVPPADEPGFGGGCVAQSRNSWALTNIIEITENFSTSPNHLHVPILGAEREQLQESLRNLDLPSLFSCPCHRLLFLQANVAQAHGTSPSPLLGEQGGKEINIHYFHDLFSAWIGFFSHSFCSKSCLRLT